MLILFCSVLYVLQFVNFKELHEVLCRTHQFKGQCSETEGKAIQRLPHLGIHPIWKYQIQTLLPMPRRACWQEPCIAVPWEALPEPDQYRCEWMQPNIGLSSGTPIEELCKDWRSWRDVQPHRKNNNINQPDHQPKSTHGGTHGSSCICSRGWPYRASMGGEALGLVQAWCPQLSAMLVQ